MSSCVCKILFKSEQICGFCCKMLRGSLFWGHTVQIGSSSVKKILCAYFLYDSLLLCVEKCAGCSVAFTTILKRRVTDLFLNDIKQCVCDLMVQNGLLVTYISVTIYYHISVTVHMCKLVVHIRKLCTICQMAMRGLQ